ncbi:MAG TPA: tRNA (adenosine(37)-N6)-threonylcarbamoyltransferase complex transferase subunit TsaD [Candidatus Absconditabacterales bacterium]|nr:tRNA (adenosine(37)-N6)-threonylcarbamoyltransferase complex transferase subunit TsaD [Candidatus Absconditabacterales bacterium]
MKTLAIETSCDDTSLGIVTYDQGVFTNPVLCAYSQITDHQPYGGVVPEVAYRLHEEKILSLLDQIGWDEIMSCDSITVTLEPGLPGSLVVGNAVASMLGNFLNKPIIRVNHIDGHIFSILLDRSIDNCPFPWLILTASGGHNEMYIISGTMEDLVIKKIGYSLDDAAGESFDKVARMLGGSYPGGPWISQMAQLYQERHMQSDFTPTLDAIHFKRILLDGKGVNKPQSEIDAHIFDFSFSGMKSQVYQLLTKHPLDSLSQDDILWICHEFQECVTDMLIQKILRGLEHYSVQTIGLVGGVSANDRLYDKLTTMIEEQYDTHTLVGEKPTVLRPVKKVYSTDNAAMIGVVGILKKTYSECS